MIFDTINDFRLFTAENLAKVISDTELFYADGWTFIHFLSGIFVMFLIMKLTEMDMEKTFFTLFFVLIIYEIWEWSVYSISSAIMEETRKDVLWDIIFGFLGGVFFYRLQGLKKERG